MPWHLSNSLNLFCGSILHNALCSSNPEAAGPGHLHGLLLLVNSVYCFVSKGRLVPKFTNWLGLLFHWRQPSLLLYNSRLDPPHTHLHLNNTIINCLFFYDYKCQGSELFWCQARENQHHPPRCKEERLAVLHNAKQATVQQARYNGGTSFSLKCEPNGSSNCDPVP